jgi:hypothetical protein
MILHGHVDASYFSRSYDRFVAGAYLFLGDHHQPLKINGAIHTFSTIIPCIVSSAGEAEYAALFAGAQHAVSLRTILADLGHPQPPTMLMCDNTCAIRIANDFIKQRRSKSIDMRFHWICDHVRQGQNLDPTKHNGLVPYIIKPTTNPNADPNQTTI